MVGEINETATREGKRPIVFIDAGQRRRAAASWSATCKGCVLDMFHTFVEPLEEELGIK